MEGEVAGESAVRTKRVVGPAALSSFFLSFFIFGFVCLFCFIYHISHLRFQPRDLPLPSVF